MRGIVQLGRVNGLEEKIVPAVKAYARAAARETPYSTAPDDARSKTDHTFEALLGEAIARPELLAACSDLRRARDRRLYLSDDQTAPVKWLSVLVLGALTQLALLLVHVGNRPAMRTAIGVFTVAFTFCLVMIAVFDEPFETVLAHQPEALFRQMMSEL
jgi:hypothetical protein